jgi:putative ABC transport system permease protein
MPPPGPSTRSAARAATPHTRGYTSYALRLNYTSRPAIDRTVAAVGQELRSVKGFTGFTAIPAIIKAADYPGKDGFKQIARLLTVVTILALLSALVLLSNTMSTLSAS